MCTEDEQELEGNINEDNSEKRSQIYENQIALARLMN